MNTIKNIPTDKVIKSAIIFQVLSKSKSKKIRECCHPDKVNDLQQKKKVKKRDQCTMDRVCSVAVLPRKKLGSTTSRRVLRTDICVGECVHARIFTHTNVPVCEWRVNTFYARKKSAKCRAGLGSV